MKSTPRKHLEQKESEGLARWDAKSVSSISGASKSLQSAHIHQRRNVLSVLEIPEGYLSLIRAKGKRKCVHGHVILKNDMFMLQTIPDELGDGRRIKHQTNYCLLCAFKRVSGIEHDFVHNARRITMDIVKHLTLQEKDVK